MTKDRKIDRMMPPDTESASGPPESAVDAVVADNGGNRGKSENPSLVATDFVAAFRVSREHDGSLSFVTSARNGDVISIVAKVPFDEARHWLADVPRLPIKDLANPGVALVVRSSFEHLVRRARSLVAVLPVSTNVDERDAVARLADALEPFAEVAP